MTQNQIAYWKLQEERRANQESERNKEGNLQEQISHNRNVEAENYRHNMATETLGTEQLVHNRNVLSETTRHNTRSEEISEFQSKEAKRHNIATETETERHNIASEMEIARHNQQSEAISWSGLYETQRHNQISESQNWYNLQTQSRIADIHSSELSERVRHNQASEQIQSTQAANQVTATGALYAGLQSFFGGSTLSETITNARNSPTSFSDGFVHGVSDGWSSLLGSKTENSGTGRTGLRVKKQKINNAVGSGGNF